jgi:probable DNA repair protein
MLVAESAEAAFAIEGGQALADYPLVDAALGLLSLAAREQSFSELSAWLRSAYLQLGGLPARVAFELQLREHNVVRARLDALPALARRLLKGEPGELLAGEFDRLQAAVASRRSARADAGTWAREFADWLSCAGWPGQAALGSDEQQQRERCEELLGELAQLSPAAGLLGTADAVALLVQLAQRTPFEAATGDVPVTLTASTSDPLVCYDGIWVAGLNAEQWPRPARPDAFLGVAAQRAAGMPAASAEGQAALARSAMSAWRARSPELVFSCARVDGDAELQPSSLLGLGAPPEGAQPLPQASVDTLCGALRAASSREALPAGAATPLAEGAGLPGGTRALGLQAQCPFHAFAELRLAAQPLPEPAHGLPARERGVLLHAALQGVWQQLAGSAQLLACQGEARVRLVRAALEAAVSGLRTRLVSPPPLAVLAIETRRQQALILQLLAAEEQRAPFVVAGLEQKFATHIGGVPIDVRMDRVDKLLDEHGAGSGHTVVLDYKSGAPSAFDPLAERPTQAQLLAYGLLAPGELAAIAMVHLREARVQWRGATASPGILPGLARKSQAGAQWRDWRAHWARVVPALAQQLAAGMAAVDPLPGACRTCHLTALCRVGSARHERGRDDAGTGEEPLAHEQRDAGAEAGNAGSGDE